MPRFVQYYQRTKNIIHAIQALAIFVAWALTIAILTKKGKIDRRVWYNFALCWCCIPALIYQAAFPVFPRIRRFSNAYIHAVIDTVYTIFWLAAFACLIAWVRQGSHAAKGWESKDSLCEKFAWGPVSKCKLGQDAWIVGVIICLLFALTSAFSIYGVFYYRKNGALPEYSAQDPERLPNEHHGSSTDASDKLDDHPNRPLDHSDGGENHFMHTDTEEQTHPSGPITWNLQQPHTSPAELGVESNDTSYYGGGYGYESSQQLQSQPAFHNSGANPPYDMGSSNNSQVVGGLNRPPRQYLAQEYDHSGYASGGRVDFPEGDYSR